jgi:hypothetical protein
MENHRIDRRTSLSLVGPLAPYAAAALVAVAAGVLWLGPAHGRGWQLLLPAALLVLPAVVGIAWQVRARAATRLETALDAYAAREIARGRRRPAPPRLLTLPSHPKVGHNPRASATHPPHVEKGE